MTLLVFDTANMPAQLCDSTLMRVLLRLLLLIFLLLLLLLP
jgi:hypothetical protein